MSLELDEQEGLEVLLLAGRLSIAATGLLDARIHQFAEYAELLRLAVKEYDDFIFKDRE